MANETLYSQISSDVSEIKEAVEMHLMKVTLMPRLVQVFTDGPAAKVPRTGRKYAQGTAATLTEGTEMTANIELTRSVFGTIAPDEVGNVYHISDERAAVEPFVDIYSDLVESIGQIAAQHIDTNLVGKFTSLTGGTVGTAGSVLTYQSIAAAESILYQNGVPGPYFCVLHPYQMFDLSVATATNTPLQIDEDLRQLNGMMYLGSWGDIQFYRAPVMTAGTAVTGALFSRRALAFDLRRELRIEPDRRPRMRGVDMVWTLMYGAAAWRTEYGVQIKSDASVPS